MAGILSSVLNASANPNKRSEVTQTTFDCLNQKTALILFAVAEAVLGEGFLIKAPRFIETVDDYLNYQRPAQREQFLFALLIAETTLGLTVAAPFDISLTYHSQTGERFSRSFAPAARVCAGTSMRRSSTSQPQLTTRAI